MRESEFPRYMTANSAGSRDGKRFAVLDRLDLQGGRGMRRVSFHRTFAAARAEANRLNTTNTKESK